MEIKNLFYENDEPQMLTKIVLGWAVITFLTVVSDIAFFKYFRYFLIFPLVVMSVVGCGIVLLTILIVLAKKFHLF